MKPPSNPKRESWATRVGRILEVWAGLRTFAPDGLFVIGPDPRVRGFTWAAGLGGHGITTCGPAGELAASWVLEPARNVPNAFDPARFARRTGAGISG